MKKIIVCVLLGLIVTPAIVKAQIDGSIATPQYVDVTDMRLVMRGKNSKKGPDNGIPEKGKLMLFVVPAVGSNPSLGAFYGIGATGAMFLGDPATTSISNLSSSILFSTESFFSCA